MVLSRNSENSQFLFFHKYFSYFADLEEFGINSPFPFFLKIFFHILQICKDEKICVDMMLDTRGEAKSVHGPHPRECSRLPHSSCLVCATQVVKETAWLVQRRRGTNVIRDLPSLKKLCA
jgi:hypothetical protein